MSPNHRLRTVLAAADLTPADLAERVGSDPKTVSRWITQGRRPHPSTRARVAQLLDREETYLWPDLLSGPRAIESTGSELVQMWPTRSAVEPDVWRAVLSQAKTDLSVLVYAGGFLIEALGLPEMIRDAVGRGARVRLLLGDPDSPVVEQRGIEEGLPSLPGRARSAAEYLLPVAKELGDAVELRVHGTPLYVSLVGADDSWLVNMHTYGLPAKDSPVLHFQRVPAGRMVPYYDEAFERVWEMGRPLA